MKRTSPRPRNANAFRTSVKSRPAVPLGGVRADPQSSVPGAISRLGYRLRPMNQEPASPRLRRAYFECRHGQLHVHNAIPAGGGFDEQTTLICLHASSTSGRVFLEFSQLLGASRSI